MDAATAMPEMRQLSVPSRPTMRRHSTRLAPALSLGVVVLSLWSMVGCSGDTTWPASVSPTQAYWALQLNYRAINMDTAAPHNTVQLTATPLNAAGVPLSGMSTVRYSTPDSNVTVSPTGLVTAHFPTEGAPVRVIASLTVQGVTLTATALVQVTDTAPQHPLATFSLQPVAGDSAKMSIDQGRGVFRTINPLPIYATDATGDTLLSESTQRLLVSFTSSDPTIATIDPTTGQITPQNVGHVTFSAATWAYGVVKQDSLRYTIGYPVFQFYSAVSNTPVGSLTPVLHFEPSTIAVGPGALVLFGNGSADSVDVVFDDSTAVQGFFLFGLDVPGGNIPPLDTLSTNWSCSQYQCGTTLRTFPVPGTYHYHSRLNGTSGTVIVKF